MAGTLKTNAVQLGDSATATQNLTIRTNADGTFTVARGNVGATTQDVLTIDVNGRIALPGSVVAFSAYNGSAQSLIASFNQIVLPTEEFDLGNRFNNTAAAVNGIPAYSFMPDVPGVYQLSGAVRAVSSSEIGIHVYKNGVIYKSGSDQTASTVIQTVSTNVYLNGTTDYVGLFVYSGVALSTGGGISNVWFNGALIAKA